MIKKKKKPKKSEYVWKNICDYCGGFEVPVVVPVDGSPFGVPITSLKHTDFHFEFKNSKVGPSIARDLCMRCLIKALDAVLGKPKK